MKKGDKVQLERKGNFIVDFNGELDKDVLCYKKKQHVLKLLLIPDGKAKKMASKADVKPKKEKKQKKKK